MAERDPAAGRFLFLQIHRLVGASMVVIGAMVIAGTIAAPAPLGPVLMVLGLLDFFLVPLLVARHWKTRE